MEDERVVLRVDEVGPFEARLTTEDRSTELSGAAQCRIQGRYWIHWGMGDALGAPHFDVWQEQTIHLVEPSGVVCLARPASTDLS